MRDPLLDLLGELPSAQPDGARMARIRARCHSRLARRAPRPRTQRQALGPFWQPIVAGLGGVYLTEVLRQALRIYGIL